MSDYNKRALLEMWNDFLDETNDTVTIGGLSYAPSQVLKEVDETAYRVGFNDWLDGEIQAGNLPEDCYNEE